MTLNELREVFNVAELEGKDGIRAVVRALRDEMCLNRIDCFHCDQSATLLNEILGDEPGHAEYTGGMNDLNVSPAADPVCAWTDEGDAYISKCGRLHFAWASVGGKIVCPDCRKPIKFKEQSR